MFSLPDFAVKRPVCILVCLLALAIFGTSSVFGMKIESTPEMDMPMMIVVTRYSGASPDEVDENVTDKVESALSSISDVESMSSTSSEGSSMVMLEFSYNEDIDSKYQDVTSALAMINLPDGCNDPTVMKMSSGNMNSSVMRMSITSASTDNITNYIEEKIVPEIEKINGVAEVSVRGGANEYISIELIENRLTQYGLTMKNVANAIANAEFEITVGSATRGDIDLSLVGSVDYDVYQKLADIPISLPSGDILHISDVANINLTEQERSSYSRQNGYETISITVSKEQSGNTIDICNKLSAVVDKFNADESLGLDIEITSNSGEDISDNINSVLSSLALGLLVAVLVLYFFFGEWRASVIVGLSMPISVMAALVMMSLFDMTINLMSLGGLVVGIGMMVDNSIVVMESCFRARTEERSFKESVAAGANLVTGSVIASTATTIVVFLPIAMMDGMAGQLFKDTCFTIVFAILASLISALTLVPLLFVKLKPREKMDSVCNRALKVVDKYYTKLLKKAITARKIVVIAAVLCLISAGLMFTQIKMELMPNMDRGDVSLSVETKTGLSLEATNEIMTEIEEIVKAEPEVESYSLSVGSGGGMRTMTGSGKSGSISISLVDGHSTSTDDFVNSLREKTAHIQNCSITTSAESAMSFGNSTEIEVDLVGSDYDDLKTAVSMVREQLASMDGVTATSSSISDGDPRAKLVVDPILAGSVGMTPYSVLSAASQKIAGITAMEYSQEGTTYKVIVEFPSGSYETISDLYGIMIDTASGGQIALMDLAEVVYEEGPTSISREDGDFVVTVSATPPSGADITSLTNEAVSIATALDLPTGVAVRAGGSMNTMMDEFSSIGYAMLTAIFLVFAVMAIQFESLVFSLVVMIAIPFSLTGAFFGLAVTGSSISMTSLIGLVMLVGIVVNNAIVLIDYTGIMRAQGMGVREAVIYASRTRMRPILMSTITTVVGLLPMALGIGGEVEMMQGMSVVVIGGLTLSTVLTLVLIPTFYLMFDKEDKGIRKQENAAKKQKLLEDK